MEKRTIGRLEKVDFPELDLLELEAKIDTGAYTSSLHCHHIEPFHSQGRDMVRFNLLDPSHPNYDEKRFELPVCKQRIVKSSNGIAQNRFTIKSELLLFSTSYPIELSLTDRSSMKYPVLLGRKFLTGKFLVDVSEQFLSTL